MTTSRHLLAMETEPAATWAYGRMWEMAKTADMLLSYFPEEFREPATRAFRASLSDYFAEVVAILAELPGSPVSVEGVE